MKHDDEKLWRLLGRARPPAARPAFAQNVLRTVRMSEIEQESGFVSWLQRSWNSLAFAAAAAVVVFLATASHLDENSAPMGVASLSDATAIEATLRSNDFAAVRDIELLIAFDDSNAWLDFARP